MRGYQAVPTPALLGWRSTLRNLDRHDCREKRFHSAARSAARLGFATAVAMGSRALASIPFGPFAPLLPDARDTPRDLLGQAAEQLEPGPAYRPGSEGGRGGYEHQGRDQRASGPPPGSGSASPVLATSSSPKKGAWASMGGTGARLAECSLRRRALCWLGRTARRSGGDQGHRLRHRHRPAHPLSAGSG